MKNISIPLLLLVLLFTGCKSNAKDFNLTFKMESINIYKFSIEIINKKYSIQQENMFFDMHAKKQQINSAKGKLSSREFDYLTQLITDSRLFEMEDTYGFDQNENSTKDLLGGILYQLSYTEEGKTKYIMIHPKLSNSYPENLGRLINYLSNFSSAHLKK